MHYLLYSTIYKVSKYLKTLLYVKELTCYEVFNGECCLYRKVEFSHLVFVVSSAILKKISITEMQNHVRNMMAQNIFQYDQGSLSYGRICVGM